jgi:hypothetical protein
VSVLFGEGYWERVYTNEKGVSQKKERRRGGIGEGERWLVRGNEREVSG